MGRPRGSKNKKTIADNFNSQVVEQNVATPIVDNSEELKKLQTENEFLKSQVKTLVEETELQKRKIKNLTKQLAGL